ncbi:hypothetical protein COBT_000329 [Conglomerata obtusa]
MSRDGRSTSCDWSYRIKENKNNNNKAISVATVVKTNLKKDIIRDLRSAHPKKKDSGPINVQKIPDNSMNKNNIGTSQQDSMSKNNLYIFEVNSSSIAENKIFCTEILDFYSILKNYFPCLYAKVFTFIPDSNLRNDKKEQDPLIFIQNIINITINKLNIFIGKKKFSFLNSDDSCDEHNNIIINEVCKNLLCFLDFLKNNSLNNILGIHKHLNELIEFFLPVDSIFCFIKPDELKKWVIDIKMHINRLYAALTIMKNNQTTLNINILSLCVEIAELEIFVKII